MPRSAALVLMLNSTLVFSVSMALNSVTRLVKFSVHAPNDATAKSYNPPIRPATSSGIVWLPLFSPDSSTCVEAVASGNGYLPCISFTKYLRKGMRNRIPSTPPKSEARNTCMKFTVRSGYLFWSM